jgi:hypothetical protein
MARDDWIHFRGAGSDHQNDCHTEFSSAIPRLDCSHGSGRLSFFAMRRARKVGAAWAGGVIGLAVVGSGCELPGQKVEITAPTQTDRMLLAYPEIQSGRVLILADFEEDRQMGLFRLEPPGGGLVRDPKKGRPETGTGTLSVTFARAEDTVVIASPAEGEAFLKRDWRPYDLLTMAVHSPGANVRLRTRIIGGAAGQTVSTQTDTALFAGWNVLRFDLAEIGEDVPLDDIREVRLGLAQSPGDAVTLHFDDLLLIGNRQHLMGDSANTESKLYVQSAGRHWNVGVPGRFELSFRNGQITRWYNLAADPYRLRNLVRGAPLGPTPVVVENGQVTRPALGASGAVTARQRILEMNEVRVIVDGLWESNAADPDKSVARRTYTIFPTGQVYVTSTATWPGEQTGTLGMAVNLAWWPAAPSVRVHAGVTVGDSAEGGSPAFALARGLEADAALLFVPYPDGEMGRIDEITDTDSKSSTLLWSGGQTRGSIWRAMLYLSSSSSLDDSQAFSRALDYAQPGGLRVEVGEPVSGELLRSDGFDPGTGTYTLTTEGNRLRATVPGKGRAVFSPAYSIAGQSSGEAWVYVNHVVQPGVVRGPVGEVLFQVPETVMKEIVVEALFRK